MNLQFSRVVIGLAALLACALAVGAAEPAGNPKVRRFRLSYAVNITGLELGERARVWMPIPPNNDQQHVFVVAQKLPGPSQQAREKNMPTMWKLKEGPIRPRRSNFVCNSRIARINHEQLHGRNVVAAPIAAQS